MGGYDDDDLVLALNAGLRLWLGIEPDEPVWVTLRMEVSRADATEGILTTH